MNNKGKGYCDSCKWKYETQYSVGCNSPSPERVIWAQAYHYEGSPCKIWEAKNEAKK